MRSIPTRSLVSLALTAVLLGGCATPPEEDPMFIRLNDLDQRVQRIERVMTNNSLLELAQRIDRLQSDVRGLRGEVELLQNQSEGGKTQSRTLYSDLEKRIAALETLGGVAGEGVAGPPGAGSALPPANAAGGGEQALYDTAFGALKSADYSKAIAGFRSFLTAYPTSPLASNAQYWLGEAFYVTREYDAAVQAFRKVSTDWPDSRKAPDALVKVGFTQAAQGKNAEARATLEDVTRRFPGSEAAQLASERLKRMPAGR
ncbi:MAG TPA: tol-pal system protein YbgF [Steroidobacteraceae bacterium]|nr:tol-pal system protein YbgF [Steroidobacteraceae bacterium]